MEVRIFVRHTVEPEGARHPCIQSPFALGLASANPLAANRFADGHPSSYPQFGEQKCSAVTRGIPTRHTANVLAVGMQKGHEPEEGNNGVFGGSRRERVELVTELVTVSKR